MESVTALGPCSVSLPRDTGSYLGYPSRRVGVRLLRCLKRRRASRPTRNMVCGRSIQCASDAASVPD